MGAGGVRDLVVGKDDRPATPAELSAMEAAVARAMEEGAFGLSTSLAYVPDRFASTDEIIALAKVAAPLRRHLHHPPARRGGRDRCEPGRGVPHRARGADPGPDLPPEDRGKAQLGPHARGARADREGPGRGARRLGGHLPVGRQLEQPGRQPAALGARRRPRQAPRSTSGPGDARARVRADFPKENPDWSDEPGSRILITAVLNPDLKKYEGKTIAEIARAEKKDPLDALIDLVVADRANVGRVTFSMSEDDVRTALAHPLVSMGTDSGARAEDGIYSQEKSHPRAWGSAARILGRYVRDEKLLTLEEAVRKMTSLPASRMGLADRGILRPGMAADVTAFDPDTVRDRSTYADPLHYSEGIPFVCVNGQLVVDGGRITSARPGRALKGPGYRKGDGP